MKHINKYSYFFYLLGLVVLAASCQKMTRPALGNYPKDANPPGGPLKFYAAFDGTSSNALMNGVDSIRADFPSNNPLKSDAGVSGKAIVGNGTDFVKYANANDFISSAGSFTLAFWEKRNGIPKGNSAFFFNFGSSNKNWANTSMFGLFDWGSNNDSCVIKIYCYDVTGKDNWFTWQDNHSVHGVMDNQWHHIAFVYDQSTSTMTLYVDGTANPNTQTWASHGPINLEAGKIAEFDIGGNANVPNFGWGQMWEAGNALDQFRLYGTALKADEVKTLYTNKQ
jgi:hypothetical protein